MSWFVDGMDAEGWMLAGRLLRCELSYRGLWWWWSGHGALKTRRGVGEGSVCRNGTELDMEGAMESQRNGSCLMHCAGSSCPAGGILKEDALSV